RSSRGGCQSSSSSPRDIDASAHPRFLAAPNGCARLYHLYPFDAQLDPIDSVNAVTSHQRAGVAPGYAAAPGSQWRYARLGAIGLAGGLFSGLLGVGGGVVMVPLLVLFGGYGQRNAHAVSLGAIIPISAAGVLTFGVAGEIRLLEAV